VFAADFDHPDALRGWSGRAMLETGYNGTLSAAVEVPAGASGASAAIQIPLPVERMRGCQIQISAMVKAENVSAKPRSWNGVKVMVPITSGSGTTYPQADIGTGTFDWRRVAFLVRVQEDATAMVLHLGLELVTGKAWFDDVRIVIRKPPVSKTPVTDGPPYRGHDLPRLRGAMISPSISPESLRVLGQEWNANVIRWQFVGWRSTDHDLAAFDAWLTEQMRLLDAALPWCEEYGLMVVLDLHSAPDLFSSAAHQDKFVAVWEMLARHYKDARAIWAYDLFNEPNDRNMPPDLQDWWELAERTAKAVRAIDPVRPIIIEPSPGADPGAFRGFEPFKVPNIIYSAHMYLPHSFTHQGIGEWSQSYVYPGVIEGKMWDKAQLEAALAPVLEFQRTYNVHIYIGEFSAIRWAPDESAYRYLKDLIEIFEHYEWDWSYHAFREYEGWSVEHGPDWQNTAPTPHPTRRQELLTDWFAQNEKPKWRPYWRP
jgi:endoglucanase